MQELATATREHTQELKEQRAAAAAAGAVHGRGHLHRPRSRLAYGAANGSRHSHALVDDTDDDVFEDLPVPDFASFATAHASMAMEDAPPAVLPPSHP